MPNKPKFAKIGVDIYPHQLISMVNSFADGPIGPDEWRDFDASCLRRLADAIDRARGEGPRPEPREPPEPADPALRAEQFAARYEADFNRRHGDAILRVVESALRGGARLEDHARIVQHAMSVIVRLHPWGQ